MSRAVFTRDQEAAVVQPAGDVVAVHLPDLRSALRSAVADGVRHLTLDFSNVQMIDSAGIGLLIAAHNSLRKAGGTLTVIRASGDVMDLFRSMRINQHLNVTEASVEGA